MHNSLVSEFESRQSHLEHGYLNSHVLFICEIKMFHIHNKFCFLMADQLWLHIDRQHSNQLSDYLWSRIDVDLTTRLDELISEELQRELERKINNEDH